MELKDRRLLFLRGYVHRAGKPCRRRYHIMDVISLINCEIFGGKASIPYLDVTLNTPKQHP
jgi:hypothetical protein